MATELLLLWKTNVAVGEIPSLTYDESEGDQSAMYEAIKNHVLSRIDRNLRACLPQVASFDWNLETWDSGYGEALRRDDGSTALLYVCFKRRAPVNETRSGSITLLDPRAGCANVAAPGLPFGRPLVVSMEAGRYLLIPGWLRHGVIPVQIGDSAVMAVGHVGSANDA